MRWTSAYSVRQPPTAVVRKRGMKANTGVGARSYSKNGIGMDITRNDPVDENDYLCHETGEFLQHFGILGMKWGVRRFQNEDGSYTEEGKKRYGRDSDSNSETKKWKKSDAENLSDDELRKRTARLQMEQNYKNLMTTQAERDRAQAKQNSQNLKNEIKKDLIKKALVVPVIGVIAVVGNELLKKKGVNAFETIRHWGNKKVAGIKAAKMIKDLLKSPHYPPDYNPESAMAAIKHPEWLGLDRFRLD